MALPRCLVCDEEVPESSGTNAPVPGKFQKKSPGSSDIPVIASNKTKFALTHCQYTILQKVLSLPGEACKSELTLGPYCRDCFTNINNVCHCMSALENLQQSVIEFRKDFGAKLVKSCDGPGLRMDQMSTRKRASKAIESNINDAGTYEARSAILDYLNASVFTSGIPEPAPQVINHMHEVMSNMNPNYLQEKKLNTDLVVGRTNGNMPTPPAKRPAAAAPEVRSRKKGKKKRKSSPPKLEKMSPLTSLRSSPSPRTYERTGTRPPRAAAAPVVVSSSPPIPTSVDDDNDDQKCWYCSKKFKTEADLNKHEQTAHHILCPWCPKHYHTRKSLDAHKLVHHKDKLTDLQSGKKKSKSRRSRSGGKKIGFNMKKCTSCPRSFPNNASLVRHIERDHNQTLSSIPTLEVQQPQPRSSSSFTKPSSSSSGGGPFKKGRPGRCKICSKIVMDVITHARVTHPEAAEIDHDGPPTLTPAISPVANPGRKPQKSKSLLKQRLSHNDNSNDANNMNTIIEKPKPGPASKTKPGVATTIANGSNNNTLPNGLQDDDDDKKEESKTEVDEDYTETNGIATDDDDEGSRSKDTSKTAEDDAPLTNGDCNRSSNGNPSPSPPSPDTEPPPPRNKFFQIPPSTLASLPVLQQQMQSAAAASSSSTSFSGTPGPSPTNSNSSFTGSSKYQFKNLLKVGDK